MREAGRGMAVPLGGARDPDTARTAAVGPDIVADSAGSARRTP